MANKRTLTIVGTLVTTDINGNRVERPWEDIPEEEKKVIRTKITDNIMAAAGYIRCDSENV